MKENSEHWIFYYFLVFINVAWTTHCSTESIHIQFPWRQLNLKIWMKHRNNFSTSSVHEIVSCIWNTQKKHQSNQEIFHHIQTHLDEQSNVPFFLYASVVIYWNPKFKEGSLICNNGHYRHSLRIYSKALQQCLFNRMNFQQIGSI